MDQLKDLNPFHATFNIEISSSSEESNDLFCVPAKINGNCFGCLPSLPVEWKRVNVAWGETARLLTRLAQHLGVESLFDPYKIVPLGDRSFVTSSEPGHPKWPLYRNASENPSRFNDAMVHFLFCLDRFAKSTEIDMRYSVFYDSIGDGDTGQVWSIRFSENKMKEWSLALACVLDNLKYAMDKFGDLRTLI